MRMSTILIFPKLILSKLLFPTSIPQVPIRTLTTENVPNRSRFAFFPRKVALVHQTQKTKTDSRSFEAEIVLFESPQPA